ncbi:MAG: bifunctional aspartate kinase/homoserine dehydrogenase I [Deltaproteobacteria bacterium]|nr:bifunctional aspartate kinase/homoserine dehydrogenase I [Deltaproteobacteria bacterium]
MAEWSVHKFGGTSVADAERIRHVGGLVRERGPGTAVVVSAFSGVTNALFALCARAARRDEGWRADLDALLKRHRDVAAALLSAADTERVMGEIGAEARDLADLLRALHVLGSHPEALEEVVAGHGELWCARIVAAHLGWRFLDARRGLMGRPSELGPAVDWPLSRRLLDEWLGADRGAPMVITGYVASLPEGTPTTLKRNGSDYSAAIFGALLDAREVVIWTDVDGVLSADPRRVPEAVLLDEMSYEEAMELAYFGAKVVHPRTMQPAVERGIPIWIKNSFRPEVKGTVIHRADAQPSPDAPAVKGFTTIDDVALLNLEGTGMVGVPGIAERLFGALRTVGVSVIVISQASSEHSICIAIPDAQSELARETIERAFVSERAQGHVSGVSVQRGCAVVAAVGDAMAQRAGVSGRFFGALGDAGVNVRAVAQGSSERNITAVIDQKDSTRALRAVHARFTLSDTAISVGVVGPGLIGRALLAQLAAQRDELKRRGRVDLRVRAIASSKHMVLADDAHLADLDGGAALDLDAFARHVRAEHLPHAVIIDCTASDAIANRYAEWLRSGIHVVTPNKRAASGPLARWDAIREATKVKGARYLGEATVGAGLPVIATLKDLLHTGDRVRAVEGVLSGTLSWMFNTLTPDAPFSTLLREARRLGYTEPDPREDLSGLDFARKLVVLAREMGRAVRLEDVAIEDLAPGAPFGAPLDELVAALRPVDARLRELLDAARARGEVLRYVGVIPEEGMPKVSLRALPATHPFARLQGTDNVIAFRTARYDAQPLVVQGPGAGPEVTAGGVFGDLLRLAAHLGAPV